MLNKFVVTQVLSFQAGFGHFLTIYWDFCLKIESQNEQPLAHK